MMRDTLSKGLARFNLRTKLFLLFFALLMFTLALSSYGYYNYSLENAVAQYSKDTYQSIKQSNTILDLKLQKIVENSELMNKDKEIYRIFRQINPDDPNDLLRYDRELKRVIGKYFDYNEQIYAQTIMTSYYTFGDGFIPYDQYIKSELHQHIVEGNGSLVWEPTYDFVEMYNQEDLANYDIDEYRYLFASGRVLNVFDNSSGEINYLPREIERPVLLVNFKIDFFEEYYRTLLDGDGSMMYFIAAPNGRIVSASGEQSEALAKRSDWVTEAVNGGSGIVQVKDRGDAMIVSYDTSQITGWTLISAVRSKDLIPQVSGNIFMMVAKLGAVVLALSLILAYSMSMLVTKPLNHLMKAIRKTGQGYFATRVPVRGYGEFEKLSRRFNEMNDKIQQLIHENYEVKLLEKQSQINLLNTQLNPHFLYNTLNLVNCIAIEHHNREISRIVASLSRMLHYTVENNKPLGTLQEELDWLESYIYIMRCRFEGGLDYGCYVEPELLRGEVPRLFLQPFVENAFIHGFEELEEGRVLRISGWIEEGHRYFSVRDNGKGMSSERIEQVMSGTGSSVGMRNVHQRLKLMYGERYGITIQSNPGSGTVIMICLPGVNDAAPTDLQ